MDDEELLAAIANGDSNALKEIFDRHAGWLATRLRASLPAHAVEDVLQETFLAVWRGAGGYRRSGQPGGWIWGIARRQAALWIRKHHRTDLTLDILHDVSDAENPADQAAIRADIDAAFANLETERSDDRRLARLAFMEDRPVKEIANRLEIPEGTVKSRLFSLRRRLKAALKGKSTDYGSS